MGYKVAKKKFASDFKSKLAIEALKDHKITAELASEFEVHPTHRLVSLPQ